MCRRFFWQQYDARDHANLTAAYERYHQGASSLFQTGKRHPGRSEKIVDQHETDFLTLTSVNLDQKWGSPKRAVRVVAINECSKEDVLGSLPIEDNNQEIIWQFEDFNGWKNYCTHHIGALNQAVLADKKEINLKAWYPDKWLNQIKSTKIWIDLEHMQQVGPRSTRNVRLVHVTPILQKGDDGVEAPSQRTGQPVWYSQGPRIKNPELEE